MKSFFVTSTVGAAPADHAKGHDYGYLAYECYKEALNFTDISYDTTLQIARTYSNIYTNYFKNTDTHELNICCDTDTPDSWFNQLVHGGNKFAGHTAVEWGLGLGLIIPIMIGVARRIYIIKHEIKIKSEEYLYECIKATREKHFKNMKMDISPKDLSKQLGTIYRKLRERFELRQLLDNGNFHTDKEIEDFIVEQLKESDRLGYFAYLVNKVKNHPFVKAGLVIYNNISDTVSFFWFTLMGAILVGGVTLAFAPPFLRTITFSSIAITVLINGAYAIKKSFYQSSHQNQEYWQEYLNSQIHIRQLMKSDHDYFKQKLKSLVHKLARENQWNRNYKSTFPKLFPEALTFSTSHYKRYSQSVQTIRNELSSKSNRPDTYQKLSSLTHPVRSLVISLIKFMVDHATTVFFILWLFTLTFTGLITYLPQLTSILSGLSSFFGNQILGFKLAGIAMIIAGAGVYAHHRLNILRFKYKADSIAEAQYKPEKNLYPEHIKKRTAFNVLHFKVQELHDKLSKAKKAILEQRAIRTQKGTSVSKATKEAEDYILHFEIVEADNHLYFSELRTKLNKASSAENILSHLLTFISGITGWTYNVRNLALYGGPLAVTVASIGTFFVGPAMGPIAAFVTASIVFGLMGGVINLGYQIIEEKEQHKMNFLDQIDTRLSLLSKQHIQLSYLCKLFEMLQPKQDTKRVKPAVTHSYDNYIADSLFKPMPIKIRTGRAEKRAAAMREHKIGSYDTSRRVQLDPSIPTPLLRR